MITDLFSHKIHSSSAEWPDKLVEFAAIFNEFDGQIFDRVAVENRLKSISPRVAVAAAEVIRDPSKFRDEISAYPAYLGLYHLKYYQGNWVLVVSETAKKFLLDEEPDVGAFMRLQLSLFQYPNGMGVAYSHNHAHIQANARDRTLDFIHKGVHASPFRLSCKALTADAELRSVDLFEASISIRELYALVNYDATNRLASPPQKTLIEALQRIRSGRIQPPQRFESRFHILDHTQMIQRSKNILTFRKPENQTDGQDLREKVDAINSISNQFNGFDSANDERGLMAVLESGEWGSYFDGVRTLSARIVSILARDMALSISEAPKLHAPPPLRYELKQHVRALLTRTTSTRRDELVDPEATRIKRERRSLMHKQMVMALSDLLYSKGAVPKENPHIDLYAEIPKDGAYLFEVKSGGENLLAQVRKGVSQLYEYRFRYRSGIRTDVVLCLVLPNSPTDIPWLEEYLCSDRDIAICWLSEHGEVVSADSCYAKLEEFLGAPSV